MRTGKELTRKIMGKDHWKIAEQESKVKEELVGVKTISNGILSIVNLIPFRQEYI